MTQNNISQFTFYNSGLVGELQRGESDIGWADLYLIPDRMKYIDYTAPYIVEYASFMLGQHHPHCSLCRCQEMRKCLNAPCRVVFSLCTLNWSKVITM